MTKQQIEKEWDGLRLKFIEDRPKLKGSYPSEIVQTRELLLFARFALCRVETRESRRFYESLYRRIMNFYELQRRDY